MKKKILTVVLVFIMLMSVSLTASAAEPQLLYDSSYNAETKLVSVTLYVTNAVGLESADFNLAFNPEMYEFDSFTEAEVDSDAMIVAGKAATDEGLCTCSLVFMYECEEDSLDEQGRLELVTFFFKPLSDDYDINAFCFWASSFDSQGVDIVKRLNIVGDKDLMEGLTDMVTVKHSTNKNNTTKATDSVSGSLNTKWYVYLIAGVLAVGAIAGIAIVAIKSGQQEQNEKESEEKKNDADDSKEEN